MFIRSLVPGFSPLPNLITNECNTNLTDVCRRVQNACMPSRSCVYYLGGPSP